VALGSEDAGTAGGGEDLVAVEEERDHAVATEDAVLGSRLARPVIVAVGKRRQAESER